jgi:hypothetical protein
MIWAVVEEQDYPPPEERYYPSPRLLLNMAGRAHDEGRNEDSIAKSVLALATAAEDMNELMRQVVARLMSLQQSVDQVTNELRESRGGSGQ